MATEPLPVADRVELAKAIIELAAAEAAAIDLTRGRSSVVGSDQSSS